MAIWIILASLLTVFTLWFPFVVFNLVFNYIPGTIWVVPSLLTTAILIFASILAIAYCLEKAHEK